MRRRPLLYPEVTTVRLRAGTLDRLHRLARERNTTVGDLTREVLTELVDRDDAAHEALDALAQEAA
jgi:predicted transcriptional regulator